MKIITVDSIKYGKKEILVDDQDYEYLMQWKWCINKYRYKYYAVKSIYNNGKTSTILMHRVLLGISGRENMGDHIDGNGLNNQRNNLRKSTNSQNMRNVGARKNSSSKYKGVHWCNKRKKWVAQITLNYKNIPLGRYANELEAAIKYNEAAKKYHGEFAKLNIIQNG